MNIINLLKTEWLKFRKNAVVSLLGILFLIFMPTAIFIGKEWKNLPSPLPNNSIFFEYPSMWSYLGYVGNWLVFFFIGLMVVFMITLEVNFKTLRQNVISGYTRKTFFLAKLSSMVVLCLIATFIYTVVGLAIGLYHTEGATLAYALDNDWAIPRFFLMSLGYTSLAFFISFVIKRSGISVLFYLIYVLMIELLLRWGLHFGQFKIKNESMNYYPANSFEDLMPNPAFKFAELIPFDNDLGFEFLLTYNQAALTSIFYIIVFISLAYYAFMKRDI